MKMGKGMATRVKTKEEEKRKDDSLKMMMGTIRGEKRIQETGNKRKKRIEPLRKKKEKVVHLDDSQCHLALVSRRGCCRSVRENQSLTDGRWKETPLQRETT